MNKPFPVLSAFSIASPLLGLIALRFGTDSFGAAILGAFIAPVAGVGFGITALVKRERPLLVAVFGLLLTVSTAGFIWFLS